MSPIDAAATLILAALALFLLAGVIGIHIRADVIVNGLVDVLKFRPVARLGYMDYTVVDSVFRMDRPDAKIAKAAE